MSFIFLTFLVLGRCGENVCGINIALELLTDLFSSCEGVEQ